MTSRVEEMLAMQDAQEHPISTKGGPMLSLHIGSAGVKLSASKSIC
jgi:hypothetical protein